MKIQATQRYGAKSVNYERYVELAQKYMTSGPELRMTIDALMKSDGKIFGIIVSDFHHLESICFWSEQIN